MNAITVGQLINNNATDKDFKPFPNLDFKYGPYSSPKVFLHGGRVLDLIFLPTTLKTETIGSIITTYYHGDWHVINTNEFVMKRGTAGDYSDYILESKNLEYK